MALLIDHQPITQPTGTVRYGPRNIDDTFTMISCRLARCTSTTPTFWPNASTGFSFLFEVSVDGGPFEENSGAASIGGIYIGGDGTEVPETVVECTIRPGINRQARLAVTVTGGPLVSQLTVEVT